MYCGRNNMVMEITREELEFLMALGLARFGSSYYNKANRVYEDYWRYS